MKMVMVVYNEAIDMEVMEILESCALKNYTKVTGVYGRGETSGVHLGSDVWPGRNNILYVASQQNEA
ncbi:MAG: PG0541 family transporter-associated protein, partial [Candidatus Omnitrophota bacterium]